MSMKRLLFIAHRVPYPPDKGDRVRSFHEIAELSRHFHVTLVALAHHRPDGFAASPLEQYCEEVILLSVGKLGFLKGALSLLAGKSFTQGYFLNSSKSPSVRRLAAGRPFDLAIGYCSSMLPLLLSAPAAARVMDLVDVDSVKWASYAQSSSWPWNWLYRREAATVRHLEEKALAQCDAVLVVSEAEKRQLGLRGDNIHAVGNGVDLDYFKPQEQEVDNGPALVFTGTMDYRPNVEAVRWFVQHVWAALRRQTPAATFTIVGRDPVRSVRRLAAVPGVVVTGSVPDVRPYLRASSVAIAPLQVARGIQNKILEAMASGLPVIGTPEALAGLEVEVGTEVMCADGPEQWLECVEKLFLDSRLRNRLGRNARVRVEKSYDWSAKMLPLISLCHGLTSGPRGQAKALGLKEAGESAKNHSAPWRSITP